VLDTAILLDDKGQIKSEYITDLLIEVISGKAIFDSGGEMYACRHPTVSEQDQGRIVYARVLKQSVSYGVPAKADLFERACQLGHISKRQLDEKERLSTLIHNCTKSRSLTTDTKQKTTLDQQIIQLQHKLANVELSIASILANSAEALAEQARNIFFTYCCTLGGDMLDEQVWKTWREFKQSTDYYFINDAYAATMRLLTGLPSIIIRAIARSQEWKSIWHGAKESGSPIFEGAAGGWDSNKLSLVWWSEFYDAIRNNPAPPPDEVISDDAKLQDWLNAQVQAKNVRRPTAGDVHSKPVMIRDGTGRKRPMHKLGSTKIAVNQSYKIRTPGIKD